MTSILTGDIINSREVDSNEWLPLIKNGFQTIGASPKIWEIYRGDSFQIEIIVNPYFNKNRIPYDEDDFPLAPENSQTSLPYFQIPIPYELIFNGPLKKEQGIFNIKFVRTKDNFIFYL